MPRYHPFRFVFAALSFGVAACSPQPAGDGPAAATDTSKGAPPASTSSPPLTGTYWRLVALGDQPVTVTDTAREPHLTFAADTTRVTGSGGCNRLFGAYTLNGDRLSFGAVGSTKMACATGMDTETAFLPALGRVAHWRITGQQLEFTDSAGSVVARLEARAPR